jgi:hypothetical protein
MTNLLHFMTSIKVFLLKGGNPKWTMSKSITVPAQHECGPFCALAGQPVRARHGEIPFLFNEKHGGYLPGDTHYPAGVK